ncbi:MAG TPA: ADOP family duplicated permease [Bryobacteraceae bacterium]
MRDWLAERFSWLRHHRTDDDFGEELKSHLEMQAEDYVGRGMPAAEARRRARLGLGSAQTVIENVRDVEFVTVVESVYRDFVLGLRALRKSPVFSVTAILTLGIGIGANTVVFTLLYGLLLRDLPVKNAASLVWIGVASSTVDPSRASSIPYHMLLQLRRQQNSLTDISAWSHATASIDTGDGSPRMLVIGLTGGNGFEVLGMSPYLGRLLAPADDVRGGPPEGWPVVLGYGYWKNNFGADPSVLGKQIKLSNTDCTIVGVAPPAFRGLWPGSDTTLYAPFQFLSVLAGRDINAPDSGAWCSTIARLKPGVSLGRARAELAAYDKTLLRQFIPLDLQDRLQARNAYLWASSARTGFPTFFGRVYSTPLFLMQGLVGIVLLLCCVNVAGLMMSKVYARRQEFAVRTAIGAARWRLIGQYLTESFVIALAGGALGAAAAWYGAGYLLPFFRHPNEGTGMSINPDATVFAITGISAVVTTLLFGTLPAWRAGSADPGSVLKSRTAGAARRRILGRAFIPLQVALSFALVSTATLLSQSLVRLETEKTGFDLDHVTIQTAPFHLLKLTAEARMELYHRMRNRMDQLAGVNSSSFTLFTPMTSFQAIAGFQAVSSGSNPPQDPRMAYNEVGPGYFRTMKTMILDGREFQAQDRDRSVCVLNQSAAGYLFPRQQAVGQYVRSAGGGMSDGRGTLTPGKPVVCRVIGLAEDAKFANLQDPPPRTIYFPVTLDTLRATGNLVFLMNAPSKAQAIAAYRRAKEELSPATPLVLFVTLREQMDAALGSQRALSMRSNFFAALALFLSGLGLYGLLSSSVAQRTGEIGLRMALGAKRGRVLGMILSEGLGLLIAGLALGAVALTITTRFLDRMLYGVSPFDPVRLAAITAILAIVAILAGLFPAMRAASIDPIQALRAE